MSTEWKFLSDSVAGTSHAADASGCQDASFVTPYASADGPVLIATCSDGAGTAKHAAAGAAVACRIASEQACAFFDAEGRLSAVSDDAVERWVKAVHEGLLAEAERLEAVPRDLACTLLLAVVGPVHAVFVQIGDGATVVRTEQGFQLVFWPQNGEYQNTTFFLTDPAYSDRLQISQRSTRIDELAMLTDGLQSLALNLGAKAAHGPFFEPLFKALREQPQEDLAAPMRQFLDSPAVNQRTDDDKTLILATRIGSCVEQPA